MKDEQKDEQILTPLLADEDTTPAAQRRMPWFAVIAVLLLAAAALGGLLYLTRQLIDRPAGDTPTLRVEPGNAGIEASPIDPRPAAGSDGPAIVPESTDAASGAAESAVPAATAQPDELAALREQVRGLSERVSALGSRLQELADLEQRIVTLEQTHAQTRQDQEALTQRVEQQGRRLEAIVVPRPAPARSAGSAGGASGGRIAAVPQARPPFSVLGVEHWGGVAQVAISRAQGATWLVAGESLDGWQVLAIQGREVIWRAPSGQTVTQPVGGP
ncbi:MAG: hypothetical protein ACOY5H_07680 [Pseudomonadota bacterium]|jgi:hypothetical protein